MKYKIFISLLLITICLITGCNNKIDNVTLPEYDTINGTLQGFVKNEVSGICFYDIPKNKSRILLYTSDYDYSYPKVYDNELLYVQDDNNLKDIIFKVQPLKPITKIAELSIFCDVLDYDNNKFLIINNETNSLELYFVEGTNFTKKFTVYIKDEIFDIPTGIFDEETNSIIFVYSTEGKTIQKVYDTDGTEIFSCNILNNSSRIKLVKANDHIFALHICDFLSEGYEERNTIYRIFINSEPEIFLKTKSGAPKSLYYDSSEEKYLILLGVNNCMAEIYNNNLNFEKSLDLSQFSANEYNIIVNNNLTVLYFDTGTFAIIDLKSSELYTINNETSIESN